MHLEDYFDFFDNPHAIRVKGRRIGLEHIIERYKEGQNPEQIADYFDDLPLESIYAAILYYLHNRADVDAYLTDIETFDREQRRLANADPSPASVRMRTLFQQHREQRGA